MKLIISVPVFIINHVNRPDLVVTKYRYLPYRYFVFFMLSKYGTGTYLT
jgi:hypothetical protein